MAKKSKAKKPEEIKEIKTSVKDSSKTEAPAKKDSKKKSENKKDSSSKKSKNAKSGNKVTKYFRDLKSEFKKVVWPSKKQVFDNTIVVLVTIFIFMIIVGGFDTVMWKALQLLVSKS